MRAKLRGGEKVAPSQKKQIPGVPREPGSLRLYPGLALVLMVLVAYIPVMGAGWIWDDDAHVTNNETMQSLDGLRRIWFEPGSTPQYYPLVFSSFWIEYQLWAKDASAFHLANVLLNGLNACLIWRVLLKLQVRGAWLAAAVFALHPVHVESVAWVTERKNLLSAMFYLFALLAFLHFVTTRDRRWYLAAFAAFVAALLSKTVTCTLPAVLFLLIWWRQGQVTRRNLLYLTPWFAVGVGFGLLTIWMEKHFIGASGAEWSLTPIQRVLIAGNALAFYVGKLVWPKPLLFIYPRWQVDPTDPTWYIAPAIVLAVFVGLWVRRRRLGRGPLVAVLVFAGTLFPALGFFDVYPFRYSFVADHFQYLASVPLIALAVAAGYSVLSGRQSAPYLAGGLLLILAILTGSQCTHYKSEQTIWEDTLAKHSDSSIAHARLGLIRAQKEEFGPAADHFREVVRLKPDSVADRLRHANLASAAGRIEESAAEYRTLLAIDPDSKLILFSLVNSLTQLSRHDEAAEVLEAALQQQPADPKLHSALGLVRFEQGRHDQGIEHVLTAQRLDPTNEAIGRILEELRQARNKPSGKQ
ncbi:MAG: tetratricopeptide repeat protein [Gemmataceae bacterium]|nr:tetratricopeptide repeat protein [Gemmataceae bacterium]